MSAPALSRLCPALPDTASESQVGFPAVRMRRLRRTDALRRLTAETRLHPADLVLPVFAREGLTEPREIGSMPGVLQHTLDSLRKAATDAVATGLGGLMLFGIPEQRDAIGSEAIAPNGILQRAIAAVREEIGSDGVIMADVCLDEFTDHGHCGVLDADGQVDNDATLLRYAAMAIAQADAGVDVVGLSGMMDGQVGVVRAALDAAGHTETVVLAYSTKYASACYGPFREAVESTLQGDRRTYQQNPANFRESLRETELDIAEGADIVMVKPALPYLDIVRALADRVTTPIAAYHVSGEYAMVQAAADRGWIDGDRMLLESLTSIRRAGAQLILTYGAMRAAHLLHGA